MRDPNRAIPKIPAGLRILRRTRGVTTVIPGRWQRSPAATADVRPGDDATTEVTAWIDVVRRVVRHVRIAAQLLWLVNVRKNRTRLGEAAYIGAVEARRVIVHAGLGAKALLSRIELIRRRNPLF